MTGEAFICDAVRTPIGRYAGALATVRADDLAAVPIAALMARHPGLDWQRLDDVILGCANQAGEDNRNVARMASLLAGLPVDVAGATVNRLCGSGLEAVAVAARAIKAGEGEFYIAGGVESMSRSPFVMPKAEAAFSRQTEVHDTTIGWRFVNPKMEEAYGVDPLGVTAENVASEHQVTRADQDAFALAQPAAGRAGAGGGAVRGRDRPGAGEAWPRDGRGHQGRASPPGDDAGAAGPAQAGLPARRDRHRRQLVGRERRGGSDADRLRSGGEGAGAPAAGARPWRGLRRRAAPRHGPGADPGDAQAAGPAWDRHRRDRADRAQRGLRRPGRRRAARAWACPRMRST